MIAHFDSDVYSVEDRQTVFFGFLSCIRSSYEAAYLRYTRGVAGFKEMLQLEREGFPLEVTRASPLKTSDQRCVAGHVFRRLKSTEWSRCHFKRVPGRHSSRILGVFVNFTGSSSGSPSRCLFVMELRVSTAEIKLDRNAEIASQARVPKSRQFLA